jgi:hypothetical protein
MGYLSNVMPSLLFCTERLNAQDFEVGIGMVRMGAYEEFEKMKAQKT